MNQKDADFFRPLWRRVVITGIVAAWCAYEALFSHETMWIVITGAALVYCVWNFFLRFPQNPPGSTGGGTAPAAPSGAPDSSPDGAPKA